jgi:hypothetical protein
MWTDIGHAPLHVPHWMQSRSASPPGLAMISAGNAGFTSSAYRQCVVPFCTADLLT